MNKRTYNTIVFDLGKVLIPFDHSIWIEKYNQIESGLGERYFKKFQKNISFNIEYESGRISDEEFISVHLEWLEQKVSKEKFVDIFSNIFTDENNVVKLLPKLKNSFQLVLLSNTSNLHFKYGWGHYNFLKYFDKQILSHEVGAFKPEANIYKAVEDYTKDDPSKHLFIDDLLENVNGAKNIGWDGIHFVGYENLVQEFKIRKIL